MKFQAAAQIQSCLKKFLLALTAKYLIFTTYNKGKNSNFHIQTPPCDDNHTNILDLQATSMHPTVSEF